MHNEPIDYASYTDSELREVLQNIDKHAAPENYARLLAEMDRRRTNGEMSGAEPSFDADTIRGLIPVLGYAQLIGSTALLALLIWRVFNETLPPVSTLEGVITIALVALGASAGMLTLKKRKTGYTLSSVNFCLQVPSFFVGGVLYDYVGFAGIWIGIDSVSTLSFSLHIEPGFQFALATHVQGWFAGIDVFAAAMLGISIAALRIENESI